MQKGDLLYLEARRKIYNYVLNNPGLHLRELSRRLKLTYNNLDYHLNYLKKLGFVVVQKENSYSRVYAKDKVGLFDKKYLNIIQQKTLRHIIIFICSRPVTTQNEIAKNLEKHPTTIKHHLKKLIELEIIEPAPIKDGLALTNLPSKRHVERLPVKNETLYRLKNPAIIQKMFITYKKSLFKDKTFKIVMEYIILATNEYRKKGIYKNIKTSEWWMDYCEQRIYDIFPHPYHV